MKNIPKKIYLNHGLTNSEMDDVNFDDCWEFITWSKDDTNGNDLVYVHISQLKEEREKIDAIYLFLNQKHKRQIEGLPMGETHEDYIILSDGDFYWDSDDDGNYPMDLNDLYNITSKQTK